MSRTFGAHPSTRCISWRLGRWLSTSTPWKWYISSSEDRLYECTNNTWHFHSRYGGRSTRTGTSHYHRHSFPILGSEVPSDLKRTTIEVQGDKILSTGMADAIPPVRTALPTGLDTHIASLPPSARWALHTTNLVLSGPLVANAISQGICLGMSDGSFKDGFGTAAWILTDGTTAHRAHGEFIVPGLPSNQSSYRSELAGIYALVLAISTLCTHYKLMSGAVEIGCDGKEALHRCFCSTFVPSPMHDHYDLIVATRALISSCPIRWAY